MDKPDTVNILIVDDETRNLSVLESILDDPCYRLLRAQDADRALRLLLENHDVEVISATNGRQAIDILHGTDGIEMVLMDIMMPEMDGYETMREIRKEPAFRTLPILALTAKAMKGDREKCLDAGASDYISKPVNTDQLLSLMRVWLFR